MPSTLGISQSETNLEYLKKNGGVFLIHTGIPKLSFLKNLILKKFLKLQPNEIILPFATLYREVEEVCLCLSFGVCWPLTPLCRLYSPT